ncbi:MAG: hypothetical protein ACOH5I_23230 [Oligoflexus sp.]
MSEPSDFGYAILSRLNLTVAILDAQTLQPLFPAQDFFGITFGYSASWTRSDLVEIADQEKTTIIDPATGNIDSSSQTLECYGPVTTSSFVNDRGQFVVLDQTNKKALVTVSQAGEGIVSVANRLFAYRLAREVLDISEIMKTKERSRASGFSLFPAI